MFYGTSTSNSRIPPKHQSLRQSKIEFKDHSFKSDCINPTDLRLDDVVKVAAERPGQPEHVRVLLLRVSQRVDLRLQLDVDGARRLAQLLEDGLRLRIIASLVCF